MSATWGEMAAYGIGLFIVASWVFGNLLPDRNNTVGTARAVTGCAFGILALAGVCIAAFSAYAYFVDLSHERDHDRLELPVRQYRAWLVRGQVLEDRKVLRVPAVEGDVAPRPDFLDRLMESGWVYDGRRESFDYFVPAAPEQADSAVITIKSILAGAPAPAVGTE